MKYGLFESYNPQPPRKKSLSGKYKYVWVEESFNFENPFNRQKPVSATDDFLGLSVDLKKIKILFFIILFGLGAVFGRLFYLQILKGNENRFLAENNRVRLKPIPAERGIFYDREGRELVQNVPSFSLSIVPQDLPPEKSRREEIIKAISAVSGVPEQNIQDLLKRYGSYSYESLIIKENLDYESALNLYIQNSELPGVLVEKGTKRKYLSGQEAEENKVVSFSHILGYLGKLDNEEQTEKIQEGYLSFDSLGKAGLEKYYEKDLRGKFGWKKIEVDAEGRQQAVLAEEAPEPGKNIFLTVDADAQRQLEDLIKNYAAKSGKKRIAGIALNPADGGVLAMVSWPSFDSNDFSGGITYDKYQSYLQDPDRPLFNRAVGGKYPSGSTVKPVIAAAALQEKVITKTTAILSTGGVEVGDKIFKDWRAGGHGATNVIRALAWSVNTFFYYVGGGYKNFTGLGLEKISRYMTLFSIGEKTGLDLPGESGGFLPSREWKEEKGEHWYVGDTYNISIGQGDLLVTPIQAAVWTAAVANGGHVIVPHFTNQMEIPSKKMTFVYKPMIKNENFISPYNLAVVKEGMGACVTDGSCSLLITLPFKTGAKTGTAQWSQSKDTHAWFTAFAPYENPQIVVTILVEEGGEGGAAAMPIARDFLSWWGKKYRR